MSDYICVHCGGRVGMMGHYSQGLNINGEYRKFPGSQGAASCSPAFTRLARLHLGHIPGFEDAFTRLRKHHPEVEQISRGEFLARIEELCPDD